MSVDCICVHVRVSKGESCTDCMTPPPTLTPRSSVPPLAYLQDISASCSEKQRVASGQAEWNQTSEISC